MAEWRLTEQIHAKYNRCNGLRNTTCVSLTSSRSSLVKVIVQLTLPINKILFIVRVRIDEQIAPHKNMNNMNST